MSRLRLTERRVKNFSTKSSNPGKQHCADGEATLCKCPRCGIMHTKFMFWTGRGVPRIYCDECYQWLVVANVDTSLCEDQSCMRYKIRTHVICKTTEDVIVGSKK